MGVVISEREVKEAILEIKLLQAKYCKSNTIIVYRALDEALKKLGWDFANIISEHTEGKQEG